ncbi:MAG: HEAT repeat domain-containing protein [Planctomycetota bacterium]|nr:HEAT repeat domain-containing protein [Planctomycetota bacterium]
MLLHLLAGLCACAQAVESATPAPPKGASAQETPAAGAPAAEAEAFPEAPKPAEPSPAEASKIAERIAQLGDEAYETRHAAAEALRELGQKARTQLRRATETTRDSEVREATQRLLADLDGEIWEGYYYYSNEPFEDACKHQVERVRFWMRVKRAADGSFTAEADETEASLGPSRMEGKVDRAGGTLSFKKRYTAEHQAAWQYEGTWRPKAGRIEGAYGRQEGGFVLYPRRLSDRERRTFEAGNPRETVYESGEYEIFEEE